MTSSILAPAAALVAWSMVMFLWLNATRIKSFSQTGTDMAQAPRGARYADVEQQMPAKSNWVSHNFTHLMEQPTVFYAAVFIIALAGGAETNAVWWAWGYTIFRVCHSLWQTLINVVMVRFLLFLGSNVCLLALTYYALVLTF